MASVFAAENALRNALQEILRMARTPPNDRETESSRTFRRDIEHLAEQALYPTDSFYK